MAAKGENKDGNTGKGGNKEPKGSGNLWKSAAAVLTGNIAVFVIIAIVFVIIGYALSYVLGTLSGISFLYSGIGSYILAGVSGAVLALVVLWYVDGVIAVYGHIKDKKDVDYVSCITGSLGKVFSDANTAILMAGIGFVAGIVSTFLGTVGAGALGAIVYGILAAVYTAVALVSANGERPVNPNFVETFQKVNGMSGNAGIYLWVTVLVGIIPGFGIVQTLMLPLGALVMNQSGKK